MEVYACMRVCELYVYAVHVLWRWSEIMRVYR